MDIGTQATEESALMQQKRTKVAIAVPARDMVHAWFAQDLASLVGFTVGQTPEIELSLQTVLGTELPSQRHALVREALRDGCDYILFLDTDMRFPKDTLFRLLSHNEDIVGVNYPTRKPPIIPTAAKNGEHVYIEPAPSAQPQPLFDVDYLGFGVILIRATVFEKVPKPWFQLPYFPKDDFLGTEDAHFCKQALKAGFVTKCDPNLSREVQHIGLLPLNYLHMLQTLRAAQQRDAQEKLTS